MIRTEALSVRIYGDSSRGIISRRWRHRGGGRPRLEYRGPLVRSCENSEAGCDRGRSLEP
jgi:hypothetical protein